VPHCRQKIALSNDVAYNMSIGPEKLVDELGKTLLCTLTLHFNFNFLTGSLMAAILLFGASGGLDALKFGTRV
jgi:hypothetical protein